MLVEKLLAANEQFGPSLAVDDGRRSLTYKQVTALASVLKEVVLKKTTGGLNVGILLPAGGAFVATFFGTLWAKRIPVVLNLLLSNKELQVIVEDANIEFIITSRYFEKLVASLVVKSIFLEDLPLRRKAMVKLFSRLPQAPKVSPDDVAVILYTSGTTGIPKGVQLTHRNLISNCENSNAALNLHKDHRFLSVLPPFHAFGLTACVLMPIFLGATVYAIPRFHPLEVIKTVAGKSITLMVAIPSMYAAILKTKSATAETFKSVRLAVSGGEPLPESIAQRFKERFGVTLRQGYGLTETSPVISVCTQDQWRDGSVGKPIPNVHVRIVQALADKPPVAPILSEPPVAPSTSGQTMAPNQDGEICVKGDSVMKGYYNKPDETRKVIDSDGWFHTGDMGRFDEDGFLIISGRIKEMLIVGGENVYPREIEAVLEEHEQVIQAAVVGEPDASRGEVPVAFVLCADGATVTPSQLRNFARERLSGFKVPRRVEIAADLPIGPTGKILKRRLRERVNKKAQAG